jgi:hypothetical protein
MNICEKTTLTHTDFASAISSRLFDSIDDCVPLMVVVDKDGKHYSSDIAVFDQIFKDSDDISWICGRVADGQDILATQQNGYTIFATQVNISEPVYAMIAVFGGQSEAICDMAEVVFGQIDIVAGVVGDEISQQLEPFEILGDSFICN